MDANGANKAAGNANASEEPSEVPPIFKGLKRRPPAGWKTFDPRTYPGFRIVDLGDDPFGEPHWKFEELDNPNEVSTFHPYLLYRIWEFREAAGVDTDTLPPKPVFVPIPDEQLSDEERREVERTRPRAPALAPAQTEAPPPTPPPPRVSARSSVTGSGKTSVPLDVRRKLGLAQGGRLLWIETPQGYVVRSDKRRKT